MTTKTGIDVMRLNLLIENESDPVVWRGPVIAGVVKQFWTDVIWGTLFNGNWLDELMDAIAALQPKARA